MKTPSFWFTSPPTLTAKMLLPLAGLYRCISRCRPARFVPHTTPLIIVGNITAGGSGKTPVVIALTQALQHHNKKVHLIAKGYKGTITAPTQVQLDHHTPHDVGDEAMMLAYYAPLWVAKDRGAALLAAEQGADVIISDDGLQNNRLKGQLNLAVIDGVRGLGNGYLLPAGPLRESLSHALPRIDAFVQIGGAQPLFTQKPTLMADFIVPANPAYQGKRIIAFAGIGIPEKFFSSLPSLGFDVVEKIAFADHYAYTESDCQKLLARAQALNATLVTTRKDAVKWGAELQKALLVLDGQLVWRTPADLDTLLEKVY